MGRSMNKSDRANLGSYMHGRNAICSANFLRVLKQVHGPEVIIEIVDTKPEPLPPIPNKVVAAAADTAFPEWTGEIKRIQKAVCIEYQVSFTDLCSQRRHHPVVRPRQVAMYLCKRLTGRSLPEIGRRFGRRDHTTASAAIRRIELICASDPEFRQRVEKLAESLGGQLA